jgi:hypothetical protein
MRYAKQYPDDMVENLTKSPGMCSDGPGSAPIEIPKEGVLSWERAIERWMDEALVVLEKKGTACLTYNSQPWSHQCTAHVDSPRRTRGQSVRCADGPAADGPLFAPEPPVPPHSPTNRADSLCHTGGRSARYSRTVRPTRQIVRFALFFISTWYILR